MYIPQAKSLLFSGFRWFVSVIIVFRIYYCYKLVEKFLTIEFFGICRVDDFLSGSETWVTLIIDGRTYGDH